MKRAREEDAAEAEEARGAKQERERGAERAPAEGPLARLDEDVLDMVIDWLAYRSPVLMLVSRRLWDFFQARDWEPRIRAWFYAALGPSDLARRNAHPRDYYVDFQGGADRHRYTVTRWDAARRQFNILMSETPARPLNPFTSMTTFFGAQFNEFQADAVISKMMRAPGWPQSKYYGQTRDEIKAGWEANRRQASALGTAMHENLENYYNGREYDGATEEFALFRQYEAWLAGERPGGKERVEPYRAEWIWWDEELQIVGTGDMIYRYVDRPYDAAGRLRLLMVDWKRSKEIKFSNRWEKGNSALTCKDQDCNWVHYCYQQRGYRLLARRHYGAVVEESYLAVLHPHQAAPEMHQIVVDEAEEARIQRFREAQLAVMEQARADHVMVESCYQ